MRRPNRDQALPPVMSILQRKIDTSRGRVDSVYMCVARYPWNREWVSMSSPVSYTHLTLPTKA